MQSKSLFENPIHLGLGATAVAEPKFTGFDWYEAYGERHAEDLEEGRLVSLFRFEEPGRAGKSTHAARKWSAWSRVI